MSSKLVIVESPAKAKTIARYLGKGYEVTASKGHVRDLPSSKFGINLDTLEPEYTILDGKEKVVSELKKKAKGKEILLASDLDREGEAIAWHIARILKLPDDKLNRIVFNEITETAIKNAVKSPRKIDMNKVDAQVARRVLDRIVGYKLSPLLWKTISRGLSAGRVQSVALKFVCDLESKIAAFKSHKFFKIFMVLNDRKIPLTRFEGKKFSNNSILSKEKLDSVLNDIKESTFKVTDISVKKSNRTHPNPLITSTMQQAAINELGWSASRTMKVAQQLYEGIETPEGHIAFITYMRTDSLRISDEARAKAVDYITGKFGKDYIGSGKTRKSNKKIQDAHEAIRPTYPERSPESVSHLLSGDNLRLYKLIWSRFFASQMASAVYEVTKVKIGDENDKYIFEHSGQKLIFDGFEKVLNKKQSAQETDLGIPKGQEVVPDELKHEEDQTKPSSRYTEASIVKELEGNGIGRPSTYATIIRTLLDRKYLAHNKKELVPTLLGNIVSCFLFQNFPDVINIEFTANMETELDEIENSEKEWKKVVGGFYKGFFEDLSQIEKKLKAGELKIKYATDMTCDCGGNYDVVFGRYGGYLKCSSCEKKQSLDMTIFAPMVDGKIILKSLVTENKQVTSIDEKCPKCGSELVLKKGRFGEFIACSSYPDCKFTRNVRIDAKCPKCGGAIEKLRSKKGKTYFKCSECSELFWKEPTSKKCPICDEPLYINIKKSGKSLYCEKCKKDYEYEDEQ